MSAGRKTPTVKSEPFESTQATRCHYVVLEGRKTGIFTDLVEAKQQVKDLPGSCYVKCEDRASAIDLMRSQDVPDKHIRIFRNTFEPQVDFIPNPTAAFNDEFRRFSRTQKWTQKEFRKAKVEAIRDEIIKYCLPDGVRVLTEQDEDENGSVYLDEEQYLEVYQAMCRTARKPQHANIDDCLLELNDSPYVNILDIVDSFRTGQVLRTFSDWDEFQDYTLDGRTMPIEDARKSELLAPMLQDFVIGPGAVDPCVFRRELMAKRPKPATEARGRERVRLSPQISTADLPRDLSPTVFDRASSPSPVPELPDGHLSTSTQGPVDGSVSTPPTDGSDFEFDSGSDIFDEEEVFKMVTQTSLDSQMEASRDTFKIEDLDEFDSDSEVFEEVIKLEATQPELFNQVSRSSLRSVSTPQRKANVFSQASKVGVPQSLPLLSWSATSVPGVDFSKDCKTPRSPLDGVRSSSKKTLESKRQVMASPQILRRSKRICTDSRGFT